MVIRMVPVVPTQTLLLDGTFSTQAEETETLSGNLAAQTTNELLLKSFPIAIQITLTNSNTITNKPIQTPPTTITPQEATSHIFLIIKALITKADTPIRFDQTLITIPINLLPHLLSGFGRASMETALTRLKGPPAMALGSKTIQASQIAPSPKATTLEIRFGTNIK